MKFFFFVAEDLWNNNFLPQLDETNLMEWWCCQGMQAHLDLLQLQSTLEVFELTMKSSRRIENIRSLDFPEIHVKFMPLFLLHYVGSPRASTPRTHTAGRPTALASNLIPFEFESKPGLKACASVNKTSKSYNRQSCRFSIPQSVCASLAAPFFPLFLISFRRAHLSFTCFFFIAELVRWHWRCVSYDVLMYIGCEAQKLFE